MEDDDNWRERIGAVLGSDPETCTGNFLKWREHLIRHLTLPLRVTGNEDFPWEEPYVLGGWDKKEYEELKKDRPSYTDQFELKEITEEPMDRDLVAVVKRISDGKVFEIGLSWLEASEGSDETRTTLNDYSVWRWNY